MILGLEALEDQQEAIQDVDVLTLKSDISHATALKLKRSAHVRDLSRPDAVKLWNLKTSKAINTLFDHLPVPIRIEFIKATYGPVIENYTFFQDRTEAFYLEQLPKFKPVFLPYNQNIAPMSSSGSFVYFLLSGCVQSITTGCILPAFSVLLPKRSLQGLRHGEEYRTQTACVMLEVDWRVINHIISTDDTFKKDLEDMELVVDRWKRMGKWRRKWKSEWERQQDLEKEKQLEKKEEWEEEEDERQEEEVEGGEGEDDECEVPRDNLDLDEGAPPSFDLKKAFETIESSTTLIEEYRDLF